MGARALRVDAEQLALGQLATAGRQEAADLRPPERSMGIWLIARKNAAIARPLSVRPVK